MFDALPRILASHPDAVLIQIGGNDFSGMNNRDHARVAEDLVDLAYTLRNHGAPTVYIGKLLYRNVSRYLPYPSHVTCYNRKVDQINAALERLKPSLAARKIHVWNHRGRQLCGQQFLSQDGTHLSPWGMFKYGKSWRGALVHAANQLLRPNAGQYYA